MKIRVLILVLVVFGGVARGEDVLKGLREGHPRLMVLEGDVERVKGLIQTDATAKLYFDRIREMGEKVMGEPVSERVIVGPRLLTISRQVLGRVSTLAGLYRLTGERKYAERCRDEMLAAARFKDWNPSHFLDVAEMTNAMGIGYDWIYDVLTPGERKEIREAIVEKGLKEGLKIYAKQNWWVTNTNNWNQVCNGGLAVGALAVADEEPGVAREVIEDGRKSLPVSLGEYAPDGGWEEGPTYWWYATRYLTFYFSAMQTALGTDGGLAEMPGVKETGMFRMESVGTTGKTFNYADASEEPEGAAQMFWMARAFGRPEYAANERALIARVGVSHVDPFHLFWFDPEGSEKDLEKLPMGVLFKRINVAFLRTGWGKGDAFVGVKGGDNGISHAHLDLGTFVYDEGGVRWGMDLGPDDYNLPGYFGKQRWNYYRLRTEGHNVLTLDEGNQELKAKADITGFSAGGRRVVVDLSQAYAKVATRVKRGVALRGDGGMVVEDEVEADEPVEVVWNMQTGAKITVGEDGREAVLELGGKKMGVRVIEPAGARLGVEDADEPTAVKSTVPAGKKSRKITEKLVVKLEGKVKELRLVVEMTPGGGKGGEEKVAPLNQWMEGQ
ncbi:MAG TPA: heparinase II/III family protein [Tepidisphaeraceae bacterium]|nr:heparinase II/III family protein [Tepidisphaeraceae bacterium]